MPLSALDKICASAIDRLNHCKQVWANVFGPGRAMVATAWRLNWVVVDAKTLITHDGVVLNLCRDSPAYVAGLVRQAVWRWRWKRVEKKHIHIRQNDEGHGLFIDPLFRVLKAKDSEEWNGSQKGALRSAFTNRQWTQSRLHNAKFEGIEHGVCKLCIQCGLCGPDEDSWRFQGTLVHRVLLCGATQPYRDKWAPPWILAEARKCAAAEGSLSHSMRDLLTRGIAKSLVPRMTRQSPEAAFKWVVEPRYMELGPT